MEKENTLKTLQKDKSIKQNIDNKKFMGQNINKSGNCNGINDLISASIKISLNFKK